MQQATKFFGLWCLLLLACVAVSNSYAAAPAKVPSVLVETQVGSFVVELYADAAPITVANFLRYVDEGLYTGGTFYRTVRLDNQVQNKIKIEVIQGGRYQTNPGNDDPAPFDAIQHESTNKTGVLHTNGVISMARLEPGSATSEFFICVNDQPELDFGGQRNPDGQGFAAFGKVVKGMEVVNKIHLAPTEAVDADKLEYTSGQSVLEPVLIKKISLINTREENL